MRIIAGKYRGRKLESPPSLQTRPTSDRLRETLFNILAPRIEGARFLDLCAGTGAVGIEALSRGASHVTFVDQSRKMCALIEANVGALKVDDDEIEIVSSEALVFLQNCVKKQAKPSLTAPTPAGLPVWGPRVGLLPRLHQPFDIIFFDPPYAADSKAVLDYVAEYAMRLLAEAGVMIVEHYKKKELAENYGPLRSYRAVKQGDSVLTFYERTAA
jgi:16S rRNA (guanine966-N2)-methyltransferase